MAVKSKEEILDIVKKYVGDDTSDEALGFIEDISDTLESRENGEDWKTRFEENDAEWRRKYKERFFEAKEVVPEDGDEIRETETDEGVKTKFEELFD